MIDHEWERILSRIADRAKPRVEKVPEKRDRKTLIVCTVHQKHNWNCANCLAVYYREQARNKKEILK